MTNLLPKYKCVQIAREVNRLIRPTPAVTWEMVREFAEPRLNNERVVFQTGWDAETRRLVASAMMREIRMQHVWTP